MFNRFKCYTLVAILISTGSVFSQSIPSKYSLVPREQSKMLKKCNINSIQSDMVIAEYCANVTSSVHLASAAGGIGGASSVGSMIDIEAQQELTCYKCSFKKLPIELCGDYKKYYEGKNQPIDCPKIN